MGYREPKDSKRSLKRKAEGKAPRIKLGASLQTHNIELPCNKCDGCYAANAQQYAMRCMHEASMYDYNAFVTLTYDNDTLPEGGFLEPDELRNFIKRLRISMKREPNEFNTNTSYNLRYLACGEYGTQTLRPHYHALLFNVNFKDRASVGRDLLVSDHLHTLWPHGQCKIGTVTAASAAYVAGYAMKKHRTPYWRDDHGNIRPEPFLRMSTQPALGVRWLDKYKEDLKHGYVPNGEQTAGIPRAYRQHLKKIDSQYHDWIEYKAYIHAQRNKKEDTRLPEEVRRIRAKIHASKNQHYEEGTL